MTRWILSACLVAVLPALSVADDQIPTVDLNSDHVVLGHLGQILVRRTDRTPKKVDVSYSYDYQEYGCQEWDYRQVYGPDPSCGYYRDCDRRPYTYCCATDRKGYCSRWCHGYDYYCYDRMYSCYHDERVCTRHGWATRQSYTKEKLVFKKAYPLNPGEQELFRVWVTVPDPGSDKDILHGEATEAAGPYTVERGNWHDNHLNFNRAD